MDSFELGETVKDQLTGMTGVIIATAHYLYEADQALVQPKESKDGVSVESKWFPLGRLSHVE